MLCVSVLVTDHHLPGAQLPEADVILNPNQADDSFASKSLAGVGVVFYLLVALRRRLRELDWFKQHSLYEPNLAEYLDIVALGTVADVVPLDRNNRILVNEGLKRIRARCCVQGITALLDVAERNPVNLVAADLGFAIANLPSHTLEPPKWPKCNTKMMGTKSAQIPNQAVDSL